MSAAAYGINRDIAVLCACVYPVEVAEVTAVSAYKAVAAELLLNNYQVSIIGNINLI